MAEPVASNVRVDRRAHRALVSLRVVVGASDTARDRLGLAGPANAGESDWFGIELGPGHWLLVSDRVAAEALIDRCAQLLADVVHLAVDESAALLGWVVSGPRARERLARGTGLDLRPASFPAGASTRTRLAQLAAIVRAIDDEALEILIPRSYGTYFETWLLT